MKYIFDNFNEDYNVDNLKPDKCDKCGFYHFDNYYYNTYDDMKMRYKLLTYQQCVDRINSCCNDNVFYRQKSIWDKPKGDYWLGATARCRGTFLANHQAVNLASHSEDDGGANADTKKFKKNQKKSWISPENGPVNISQVLYQYPCCPPEAYKNVKEYYLNSNLNYLCAKDHYVDRDVELWCIKLMHWRLSGFDNYYKESTVQPYFNAYNRLKDQVYYSVEQSVVIGNELLMHQFDNNSKNIFYFLTDLLNIIDKRIPKCNTCNTCTPKLRQKLFF